MTSSIKEMILRCMERMRAKQCATCDNSLCPAGKWQRAFAVPPQGRDDLFTSLRRLVEGLVWPQPATPCFKKQVEEAIERLIGQGDVGVDQVAASMGLSRQTLYRRLKAEGASFQDVLEAKRRQLAIRYLGVDGQSVKATAYRLGFSDPAAFSRAFKRWTGLSPSSFREAPGLG
ncbi:AraC family transcriptional regulator [Sphingomonas sp.]|jgi:AraC-like DNA-binding protein|uniref:helix-turn-helix domain-containing protein n=1 Tax=Sphingomonas sp. TaxID=28214 RepID=UPI002DF24A35|nr:AraC family transcriptional regulator [Sphingomonas sp.]